MLSGKEKMKLLETIVCALSPPPIWMPPQEVPIPPTTMPKPNKPTTSDAKFDFDLDGCNISEVIMFLQKLARSPGASDMDVAFTKHTIDARIKIKEEKLKQKAS